MEDDSVMRRAGSSPYLLGTGSAGMLLITNKPINDQSSRRQYSTVDNTYSGTSQYLPGTRCKSPSRMSARDSDSGISNGMSLSPASRYNTSSGYERPTSPQTYLDSSFSNGLDRSQDSSLIRPRPTSYLNSSIDMTSFSQGRSQSTSRLNVLNSLNCSQDWSSSADRRRSMSRMGADITQDMSRTLRAWDRDDMQCALEESEERRHLLVERLKDAQETIKMQSQRLAETEDSAKDSSFTADGLRFKEKEYVKKISQLEKEKNTYHDKHMEGLRSREDLQHRIENLSTELATLRTTTHLVQSDMQRKDKSVHQLTSTVVELEDENSKLLKCKETMSKEIAALRQSLELSKSRSDYLENIEKDKRDSVDRLEEENHKLSREKQALSQKVAAFESRHQSLEEGNKTLTRNAHTLSEEKVQLTKQLSVLQDTITDLKSTLVTTAGDKERFFQQKLELSNQLQITIYDKENLSKARTTLEEQVCELNAELAQVRLQLDRYTVEKRQDDDELKAVKKVGEVLSHELSGMKSHLEEVLEQNQSLEQTRKLAFQQHELYDSEIQSLETQLKQAKEALVCLKDEHEKDRDSSEEVSVKLKEELRELKAQRNQLELKCHETEAKLRQTEQNLKEHAEEQVIEIDSWKNKFETQAASSSRKELEIQTISKKLADAEDEISYLKADYETMQSRCEELVDAQDEANRLREENRRMVQERAENQQVIQLLEMQKQILAKTSEGSMSKIHDVQQLQYQVDELTDENQQLKQRLSQLEEKDKGTKDVTAPKRRPDGDSADVSLSSRERLCDLEQQNHQLRSLNNRITEQLTTVEQENVTLQTRYKETIPKNEYKSLERDRDSLQERVGELEKQYNKLHQKHEAVLSVAKSHSDNKDRKALSKEKESYENQMVILTSQITELEESKSAVQQKNKQLQAQLDAVHEKLFNLCQEENSQVLLLQKQVNNLTMELEVAKELHIKQENNIHTLKEEIEEEKTKKPSRLSQSLESVGEDLTDLRTELQKLGDVIQGKDIEIEQLERQLRSARSQLSDKEKMIEKLSTGTGSGKEDYPSTRGNRTTESERKLEDQIEELEEEKEELSERLTRLKKERDLAVQDAEDLREAIEDLQKMSVNEQGQIDKLKKELAAKDRQIESLEEQLRRSTNMEIKKLKRGASKVELLKAENRRLQSQLTPPTNHLPRFTSSEHDESTDPIPAANHTSVGSRLGQKLNAGSSPSQRLLSHLYGQDYDKEEVSVAADTKEEKSSNSFDSSDDDMDIIDTTPDDLHKQIESVEKTILEKSDSNTEKMQGSMNGRKTWRNKKDGHNTNNSTS